VYSNTAFYGNTRTKHSLFVTLIAVGAPDGIQVNDTLTISDGTNTVVLTGKAVENAAAGQFLVQTALTPAENIDATARSIVNVLNAYSGNTFIDAYYTSGFEDTPGAMYFTRTDLSETAFTVVSSRTTSWRPVLPSSGSNYNNTSRNEVKPNRVYFSKFQEPEAVPILQYFDIGSPEESVERLVPLRDGVIVLKTDGVFRIYGSDSSNFQVVPLDTTVRIIAPHSVAVLTNKVFFFSTQGVVAVSNTEAQIVSRPIERQLLELSSALYPNFPVETFAVGYESDRKYILWTISTTADTYATQAFVYNVLTGDWTRWTKPASCGIVKKDDDRLYIGGLAANSSTSYVFQERKNFTLSDQADEQYTVNITSAAGTTVNVSSTADLMAGYTLQQNIAQAIITEVVSSTQVTVDTVQDWTAGTATAYRPIDVQMETNQFDAGLPGNMKHWADASLIFRATDFSTLGVGFFADTTAEPLSITMVPPRGTGGWGAFAWGTQPWGVSQSARARLRAAVPKQAMRSNWLSVSLSLSEAFSSLELAGISLTFSNMSSRQKPSSRE